MQNFRLLRGCVSFTAGVTLMSVMDERWKLEKAAAEGDAAEEAAANCLVMWEDKISYESPSPCASVRERARSRERESRPL